MKTYHIVVEQAEEGWIAAHALEDERVHTQGKSLDEVAANIREVALLLHEEQDVQMELVIPSKLPLSPA